jgi:hypothetical protein
MVEAKTTREISEDYNHKAPDSLLNGNEVWFRKDEIIKIINKLKHNEFSKYHFYMTALIDFETEIGVVPLSPDEKPMNVGYPTERRKMVNSGASTKSAKHHAKTSEFLARNKELNTRRSRNSGVMCKSLVGVAEADSPHTELSVSKGMKSVVPEFASVKRGNKSRGVCRK